MSVLMRGVQMPKNCEECNFKGECRNYWEKIRETYTRPSWCPLVEVAEQTEPITEDCSTVEQTERKRGEWIAKTENCHSHWVCSECGAWALLEYNEQMYLSNFCPNCGADMRGEEYE